MGGYPASKVMIIGYDAPITKSLLKYMKKGMLPNLARLVREGVWADNCLVPHPTITPPNWTTIVTGAWPGTHGITCFNVHNPGDPLDKVHQGFLAADCRAEYLWNAAAKEGKTCILINYPSTYPCVVKKGIQIGGAGLAVNEWRTPDVKGDFAFACSLSGDLVFGTDELPVVRPLVLKKAEGWQNLPVHRDALEADLAIEARWAKEPFKPQTWHLCLLRTGTTFDRAIVAAGKDARAAFAVLEVGKWSPRIVHAFEVKGKKKQAAFHFKLLKLSPNGKEVKLYLTPICQLDGWATPASVCAKLRDNEGLPIPNSFYPSFRQGAFDVDTLLDLIDMQNKWLGDSAVKLMQSTSWDIFCMHAHCPDHCYHAFVSYLEPSVCRDKKALRMYERAEQGFYESLDRMLGRIIKCADDKTLIIVTSDHGAVPTEGFFEEKKDHVSVNTILQNAGLVKLKRDPKTGRNEVVWSKSKAFAQRSVYVYVNLKGRDPHGIVRPGKEYEQVVRDIIAALSDYRDTCTGKKPFAFVLSRNDARLLGLYGDRIGDVVYGVHGWVFGEHGRQTPTAEFGMGSLRGLLVMKGPGVKRGLRLQRNVWLTDIVPTVCYLTGFPVPRDAEGAIIYQALTDPNQPARQIAELRKSMKGFESALDAEKRLTHRYE
jgi:predicted AlkP superfamily phosphohydrolase/phosphomutase